MHAVIIGATGATGRELVKQLLNHPKIEKVTAFVRSATLDAHPALNQVEINFDNLSAYSSHIAGDMAFSAMGTTLKDAGSKDAQWKIDYTYQLRFAEICKQNGIPAFALISAMGANPESGIFYSRMKGQLEERIKALNFKKLLLARPGLLLRPESNRKMEVLSGKVLRFITRLGILKRYTPIQTAQLAKAIIAHSLIHFTGIKILDMSQLLKYIAKQSRCTNGAVLFLLIHRPYFSGRPNGNN